MFKHLWIKFIFLLLAVSVVALSGTFILRELMIRDFRAYHEGKTEDRIYLIQADLEGAYERQGKWRKDLQRHEAIRALLSGFEMKLLDSEGKLVVDTEQAMAAASPLVKKRLAALTRYGGHESGEGFLPYHLFLAGTRIGTLEIRVLQPLKETLFLKRSNWFMVLSIVIVGALSFLLSIVFARRLTHPLKELSRAASAISQGDLHTRVKFSGGDELGKLATTFNHMANALETQEMLRRKLIADVAHELRTPLAVIQGEIEGMQDGLLPIETESLQSLYDETTRLKHMVNGIEELNRAEASSLTLKRQWINVDSFLQGITKQYQIIFQEKGIPLELECHGNYRLYADPERLSQIILNLLSNALKATDRGGRVTIRVDSEDGGLSITIEDTGPGIGSEDLPYIFERFYRGPGGGLGIGLTIVKELAEAHGATVAVRSVPAKGTAFAIHFPGEAVHNLS